MLLLLYSNVVEPVRRDIQGWGINLVVRRFLDLKSKMQNVATALPMQSIGNSPALLVVVKDCVAASTLLWRRLPNVRRGRGEKSACKPVIP